MYPSFSKREIDFLTVAPESSAILFNDGTPSLLEYLFMAVNKSFGAMIWVDVISLGTCTCCLLFSMLQ